LPDRLETCHRLAWGEVRKDAIADTFVHRRFGTQSASTSSYEASYHSIHQEAIMSKSRNATVAPSAAPLTGQRAHEIQAFGSVVSMPIALAESTRRAGAINLNQLLADTITLRDLYKKHHWQVSGPTFYQLHLLFDKHFNEQNELVDLIGERIMLLGGVSVAMAGDVAEMTMVPRPPAGREEVPVQISRLLHAHEIVLKEARTMARQAADLGDDGTNDLLVSSVIRTNELQVWFVAEHVVDGPLVRADGATAVGYHNGGDTQS
jgi:starvation-inducible DNA-binding protein